MTNTYCKEWNWEVTNSVGHLGVCKRFTETAFSELRGSGHWIEEKVHLSLLECLYLTFGLQDCLSLTQTHTELFLEKVLCTQHLTHSTSGTLCREYWAHTTSGVP